MKVEKAVKEKLQLALLPSYLEVVNESHLHSVPPGSETHFKIIIVSEHFISQSLVARHRLVYQALATYMQKPIHALALHTFTAQEWQQQQDKDLASPECRGGSKSS